MLASYTSGDDGAFSTLCKEHNWKRTSQRRAVFNYLCGNCEHPTVEIVWKGIKKTLPDVSLDSVYRILDDFAEAGLIRRLVGTKVLRYDADTTRHEHFVCRVCGCMMDVDCLDSEKVAEYCRELGQVDSVELTVTGICNSCLVEQDHSLRSNQN